MKRAIAWLTIGIVMAVTISLGAAVTVKNYFASAGTGRDNVLEIYGTQKVRDGGSVRVWGLVRTLTGSTVIMDDGSSLRISGLARVLTGGTVVVDNGGSITVSGRARMLTGSTLFIDDGASVRSSARVRFLTGSTLTMDTGAAAEWKGAVGSPAVVWKVSTTQVAASNTIADACTVTLPAGWLGANKGIEFWMAGTVSGITTAKTMYLTSHGNTAIATVSSGATVAGDWQASALLFGNTGTSTQKGVVQLNINRGIELSPNIIVDYGGSAIALLTARQIKVRIGTAATSGTITVEMCVVRMMP